MKTKEKDYVHDGWNEEDEKFSKLIIEKFFKSVIVSNKEYEMVKKWLKLLKQRLQ